LNEKQGRGYLLNNNDSNTTSTIRGVLPADPGLNRIGMRSLKVRVDALDDAQKVENAALRKDIGELRELVENLQERAVNAEKENEELHDKVEELEKKKKDKKKTKKNRNTIMSVHGMGLRKRDSNGA
jgi:hypothetical protein